MQASTVDTQTNDRDDDDNDDAAVRDVAPVNVNASVRVVETIAMQVFRSNQS